MSFDLVAGAHQAMLDNGFSPEFPWDARAELDRLPEGAPHSRDVRERR